MRTGALTQAELDRHVSGRTALALYPAGAVKQLAERLVDLDLLSATVLANRLSELLGPSAIADLTKEIFSDKSNNQESSKL
jgi:hypothetical protein